jgi:divalent metal cation (Fe/Co/Zn/Cd) transporter
MNKNDLFYTAIVMNVLACTLIGIGVGKFFNEYWVGTLLGLGIGILITSSILFKTFKKLSDSDNEYINKNDC